MKCLQQLLFSLLFVCLSAFTVQAQSNATVQVTAPAGVAGDYAALQAGFGPGITMDVTGPVVEALDANGLTTACDPVVTDLANSIALIDRGACAFVGKVANAEAQGAIAVIVCNNNADVPTQAGVMGGDDMGTLTIPSVMIPYGQCQTIRAELANGLMATLLATGIPTVANETCIDATAITAGVTTVDAVDSGFGAVFNGGSNAAWYTYTPASDLQVTVRSCGLTTVDTRMAVLSGPDCDPANLVVDLFNDDCDPANDNFASEGDFIATGGTAYWIYFDDSWSNAGFDFEIVENPLPMTDVTFTVDMTNEVVDAPWIGGTFNNWMPEPLTDNMDGTWSTTASILAGTAIEYKFYNAMTAESGADLAACGVDMDMDGDFNRAYSVGLDAVQNLPAVCYASCDVCPPPSCSDPTAIICDDFEGYSLSDISGQSAHWTPWGGTPGAGDDATVSDAFASSGGQSLLVSEANGDDMLLLLGNQTTGNYLLSWKMYIPAGSTGYFNTQKTEVAGEEFGMQVEFFADGTSTLDAGAADVVTYDWTADTWMNVALMVDLTNDWMTYMVDGAEVHSWPASWTSFTEVGMLQLGGVNFYGNTGTTQYIDDVLFKTLPDCPDAALICDSYETYVAGTTTGGQAPWWSTWSGNFGTDEDGIVSSDQAFDGGNSMLIGDNGVQDVLLLLGNQTAGNWVIEMQAYVPAGNIGYFNIQNEETAGVQWNMDLWLNSTNATAYSAGMGQLATGETFTMPEDAWFPITNIIDLDNGTHTLLVDGNVVLDNVAYAGSQIGALDFFSISAENTAYFDAIRFREIPACAEDAIFCDFFEAYAEGMSVVGAAPWWESWSGNTPGTAEDAFISTAQSSSAVNALHLDGNGTSDIILRLGDQTAGAYQLNWDMYVTAGATAYFSLQGDPTPGADYVYEALLNWDAMSPGTATVGGVDATYPEDAWFDVQTNVDIDNGVFSVWMNGVAVIEDEAFTSTLSAMDFWSNGDNNNFFIDNVIFRDVTPVTPDPVAVTFHVDMNFVMDAMPAFISIGGAAGVAMTDNTDGTFSYTADILPGTTVEYLFQNGMGNSEAVPSDCSNAAGNRSVDVGDMAMEVDLVCFSTCIANCVVSVDEAEFSSALGLFPNPAKNTTTLNYNFSEVLDLNVSVSNTIGQELYNTNLKAVQNGTHAIDLNKFAPGVYLVQMTDGTNNLTKRLIVQ